MLASLTEFPFAGSRAYLKPDAEPCRIIRHNPAQGTALISLPALRDASGTRTVAMASLAATAEDALPSPRRVRRRGRKS